MEELKDVVLSVYTLSTESPELGRSANYVSRLLPSIGLGAYHTSLELDGYSYTFAAGVGIIQTLIRQQRLPPNVTFKEAIPLGSCRPKNRGEVSVIVKALGEIFTPTAYHLIHRNCNHFTETLATALILHDELVFGPVTNRKKRLSTYPDWVNRLATTGAMLLSQHDDDIVPCNVWQEAVRAVGADKKVGWNFEPSLSVSSNNTNGGGSATQTSLASKSSSSSTKPTKKTLTEAQKKALAKIQKK